jgi:hypothetical protein
MEVATGMGAPITSFFMARLYAILDNNWNSYKEKLEKDYDTQMDAWEAEFQDWWKKNAHKYFTDEIDLRDKAHLIQTSEEKKATEKDTISIQGTVEKYLLEHGLSAHQIGAEPGDLIAPSQIARELGLDPARVRKALSRMREHSV